MNRFAFAILLLPVLAAAEERASIEARLGDRRAALFMSAETDLYQRSPWSIALGVDASNDAGMPYVELRYTDPPWSGYLGRDYRDGTRWGGDFAVYADGSFTAYLGATWARPDEEVGTPLRYEVRLAWQLSRRYSLELIHESNCASLCPALRLPLPRGPDDRPNDGQNWLVIRYHLF